MSRIGRLPVQLNDKVSVSFNDRVVTVKGPLGTLSQDIPNEKINLEIEGNELKVVRLSEEKTVKAAHGLYRALIQNMVKGVETPFSRNLVIKGVGYKAKMQGTTLNLEVGYSHTVDVPSPEGVALSCVSATEIEVKGIDKNKVGQCAANIRAIRKPEPYHGYGIRYKDEDIIRKEGKKAGK